MNPAQLRLVLNNAVSDKQCEENDSGKTNVKTAVHRILVGIVGQRLIGLSYGDSACREHNANARRYDQKLKQHAGYDAVPGNA